MTRVAILISGGGSNMVALADAMAAPGHPAAPCLVLSNRAKAGGLARAQARGIPTSVVAHRDFPNDRSGFSDALQAALDLAEPDLICLAGFMRILSPEFVTRWSGRMINIHPSLLPRHKGLDTHARAIAAGDLEHGCTVHMVTPELDDGPILGQARLKILPQDTPETLAARVLTLEHRLYPMVLNRVVAGDTSRIDLP